MVSKELEKSLIEAQIDIANSLKGIQSNIKLLNDHNILHAIKTEEAHKSMMEKLKILTDKYWWLILVLIAAVLLMAGYKQVATLFIPGL